MHDDEPVPRSLAFAAGDLMPRFRQSEQPMTREEARASMLFDEVDVDVLWGLLERCPTFELLPGEVLISADDHTRGMYVVLSGLLDVRLGSVDAEPVAQVTPRENVGELSLIDDNPRSAFVVASETSRVLCIGPETFWALVHYSHEVTVNLLVMMARRIRGSNVTVTESRRLQSEYKRHATVDGLTGLYNRRHLDEMLPRFASRATKKSEPLSVVMMDIDHFKRFNDTYGHQAGDLVLYNVAKVLRDRCRPGDFAARYGGEELTLVIPGGDGRVGKLAADRVRRAVSELQLTLADGRQVPRITLSAGVAELKPGETQAAWLERADQALYQAKHAGRDRSVVA